MDDNIFHASIAQAVDHFWGQSTGYEGQDVEFDENIIDPVLRGIATEPSRTGSPDYDDWIRGESNEPPEDEKGLEGHVEEVGAANAPTPQDDQIYQQTQSYAINQTWPHSPQCSNSDHSAGCPELTGCKLQGKFTPMEISEDTQISANDRVTSPPKGNLLQNAAVQGYIRSERVARQVPLPAAVDGPTSPNDTSDGLLTHDHPEIRKYAKMVNDKPRLHELILYILDSHWYKTRGQEELPKGELRKAFRKRTSPSSANSPFSAFFSPKRPYLCWLCSGGRQPNRTLERALGHARSHFNFKPVQVDQRGYTNLNTRNDQVRRARNSRKRCDICDVTISTQNYGRHLRSQAHQEASAANGTQRPIHPSI